MLVLDWVGGGLGGGRVSWGLGQLPEISMSSMGCLLLFIDCEVADP